MEAPLEERGFLLRETAGIHAPAVLFPAASAISIRKNKNLSGVPVYFKVTYGMDCCRRIMATPG